MKYMVTRSATKDPSGYILAPAAMLAAGGLARSKPAFWQPASSGMPSTWLLLSACWRDNAAWAYQSRVAVGRQAGGPGGRCCCYMRTPAAPHACSAMRPASASYAPVCIMWWGSSFAAGALAAAAAPRAALPPFARLSLPLARPRLAKLTALPLRGNVRALPNQASALGIIIHLRGENHSKWKRGAPPGWHGSRRWARRPGQPQRTRQDIAAPRCMQRPAPSTHVHAALVLPVALGAVARELAS